ncbi:MAG TPA: DNA polymerase III subunit delta [Bacillota bacterium]|nr:DNA polymerase III subunit delta [Bacillota bacterium]
MTYMEVFDEIKKNSLGSLYLFYGPEEHVKSEAFSKMREKLLDTELGDLNYQMIDGANIIDNDIINASETLPFMSERRLVVVKDHPGLTSRKSGDHDQLKTYMQRVPASTCLLFYSNGKIDRKRALYKAINKHGRAVEFPLLARKDLKIWTSREFRRSKRQISPQDLDLFLDRAGNVLERISNEIKKLVAYTAENPVITKEIINKMVTPEPEYTVFELMDSIAGRKNEQALMLLDVLLENGQNIMGIIALLSKQLRNMLMCKEYTSKGLTASYIVDRLSIIDRKRVHPFVVKKSTAQAHKFTNNQLSLALRGCAELDHNIKKGRIGDRLGLELFIIKLCS